MSGAFDCWVSGESDGQRRLHVPVAVRWRDLDGYGHVNNATMLTLLEEARVQAFWVRDTGEDDETRPLAVVRTGREAETNTLVASHAIEYRVPIPHLHDPLDVQLWISHLGAASAEVSYEVWSPLGVSPRTLFTLARSAIVFIDAGTGRPRRINEAERAAWEPYLGEPVRLRADQRRSQ